MNRSRRSLFLVVLGCIVLVAVGRAAFHVVIGTNFSTVIPGKIYRGAQPNAADVKRLVDQFGIKTVINLRGRCDGLGWYRGEGAACQELDVSLEDVNFSATRLPSRTEIRHLIEILDRSTPPIFLHCRRGSDRTGMAAVAAMLLDGNASLDEARGQLHLRFGHVPYSPTRRMDEFVDMYAAWLKQHTKNHTPDLFRQWTCTEYRGGKFTYRSERLDAPAAVKAGEPATVRIRYHNTSDQTWNFRPHQTAGIHGLFFVGNTTSGSVWFGRSGLFERDVAPGESVDLTYVLPPMPAGRYVGYFDLVEEGHCNFAQIGAEALEEELVIRD